MRCSKCGAENPDKARFCVECASPFTRRCPSCGAENPARAKFCLECAKPLDSAAAESQLAVQSAKSPIHVSRGAADASLEGERKTVTALFADIKGSTELEEDLDPEEARAIVDPALKRMIAAVNHYDGYIVQSTGDGIFALFGAPVAHEDHPQRALHAAMRMQEELRRYSAGLVSEGGTPVETRIGINTGEVVVRPIATGAGHVEYTPIGHTTNLASRMQAVAPTGSIAISESTRRQVEGYFALRPRGPTRLKGVSEPVNVYEVTGLGPLRTRLQRSAGRGLTKFVGRQREMESLKHAAEQARQGHGQIAAAVAEAGVGKSRLFHEFKAVAQSGWTVLETFSVSHGKVSAYMPVIDLLHRYFDIEAEDDARRRRQKVLGKLLELDRSLEDTIAYLYGLLAIVEGADPLAQMDAQVRRRRTQEAIKRILLRESLNQPMMLIFEDLHWIDDETQALLNVLADSIGTSRILLLVNYRPEYAHQWTNKTYYTQLRLDPLGKESAGEMLASLLGEGAELEPLRGLIIDKTEGNPFFMEEIVQELYEEGALERNGAAHLVRPLDALKIPATVQAILASRIDRLPATGKELLQTLAVIGKEFPLALVREVVGIETADVKDSTLTRAARGLRDAEQAARRAALSRSHPHPVLLPQQSGRRPQRKAASLIPDEAGEGQLERMLSELQLAEFIYEQPAVGDIEYTFKHALTQEVAYNSLLVERRKAMHERTGAAIEALYADSLDDHVDRLAHHYRRSTNVPKALDYVMRAGEQAVARNAQNEAVARFREGLELLGRIAEEAERERREAALQLALGTALAMRGPAAEGVEEVYLRARVLCERHGEREGLFTALLGLRLAYNFRGDLGRALQVSEELLKIDPGDRSKQSSARASVAQTLFFLGELGAARKHLDQVLVSAMEAVHLSAPRMRQQMLVAEPRARMALVSGLLGYPDQAVSTAREALASARQVQVPITIALAEFFCAQIHFFRREVEKVREHSEIAYRLASQYGILQLAGYASGLRGWAEALQGDVTKGIEQIREAIEMVDQAGAKVRALQDTVLVECQLRLGRLDEGLAVASAAMAHARRTGERYCAPEILRLQGELLILKHDRESAEAAFREAIEMARRQQARWWELRATAGLARLLRETGRRDEARAMLAEIYGWFAEGFETADLKDAKALLDELSTPR